MSYIVYPQQEDIAYTMFYKLVSLSYSKQKCVHIALSGGSTPKSIFKLINHQEKLTEINWQKLHFWWCDERCVRIEDKASNFGEADRLLFQDVAIPRENLHSMQGSIAPEQAILNYMQQLKKNVPQVDEVPQFDWVWLGMGDDGHTASIFINSVSLSSEKIVEVAVHPISKQIRITLTLKVINNAKAIDFLVTGKAKADILTKVFNRKTVTVDYPAKAVNLKSGRLMWHLDQGAACGLEKE